MADNVAVPIAIATALVVGVAYAASKSTTTTPPPSPKQIGQPYVNITSSSVNGFTITVKANVGESNSAATLGSTYATVTDSNGNTLYNNVAIQLPFTFTVGSTGTYLITLNVADSLNATATASTHVLVTAPIPITLHPQLSVSPTSVSSLMDTITLSGSGNTPFGSVQILVSSNAPGVGIIKSYYVTCDISGSFNKVDYPALVTGGTQLIYKSVDITTDSTAGPVAVTVSTAGSPGTQSAPFSYSNGWQGPGYYTGLPGQPLATYLSAQSQYASYSTSQGNGSQAYPWLPSPSGALTWFGTGWYKITVLEPGVSPGTYYIDSQAFINGYNSSLP